MILNEKYNKQKNVNDSMRTSIDVQSILNKSHSNRKASPRNVRNSANRSLVGDFSRSIVPIPTDSDMIIEEVNVRSSMLLKFNVRDNYIGKSRKK